MVNSHKNIINHFQYTYKNVTTTDDETQLHLYYFISSDFKVNNILFVANNTMPLIFILQDARQLFRKHKVQGFTLLVAISNVFEGDASLLLKTCPNPHTTLKPWPASKHIGRTELKILIHVKWSIFITLAFKIIANTFSKSSQ